MKGPAPRYPIRANKEYIVSITIDRMFVTPALASEWLQLNTSNRPLKEKRIAEYARDMANGLFLFNGEAIKRAVNGKLLDGQNRLEACVRANVPFETLVIQGLPEHTQATMDSGARRSAGDQLAINGVAYSRNLAAIARRVWQWEQKNYRFTNNMSPTNSEILEVVDAHPSLARSVEVAHRTALAFRVSNCTTVGTAHHIFLAIDPDDTAQFFAQFETGAGLEEGHPILALRARLIMDQTMQRRAAFHQSVNYFLRTWNAVREERDMSKLQCPPEAIMVMPV